MTGITHTANPALGLTLPAPGLTRGGLHPHPLLRRQPEAPGQARGGYPVRKGTAP